MDGPPGGGAPGGLDEDRALPLGARFAVRRLLSSGGFGTVCEAFDWQRNAVVAVKLLDRRDPAALYRFKQEFRSLADLVHPNLVTLSELLCSAGRWYFTMASIDGQSFHDHVCWPEPPEDELGPAWPPAALATTFAPGAAPSGAGMGGWAGGLPAHAQERRQPRLAPGRFTPLCDALIQLAEGLVVLHQAGRLHRDIKPPNVLVTREGRVAILDFGLAAELAPLTGHCSTQHPVGTPLYMGPEQAASQPLSAASDWYSVGVMRYEALTGWPPFLGTMIQLMQQRQGVEPPPSREAPGIPPELDALCADLLRRRPEHRPTGPEVLARPREVRARLSGAEAALAPRREGPQAQWVVGREPERRALRDPRSCARSCRRSPRRRAAP